MTALHDIHRRRLRLEPLESRHLLTAGPLHVDADSMAETPDGTGWSTAYVDLQSALDQAAALNADAESTNDITAIWLADGLYLPTTNKDGNHSPTDQRNALFAMQSGVSLHGGFAGTEESLDDRVKNPDDSWAHETILSGDLSGDDDPADDETLNDNAFTIVYAFELPEPVVLDGLTITAGNADGPFDTNWEKTFGGGVYAESSHLTITDSTLSGNSAQSYGGGVWSTDGTLTVVNSTISGNVGGGFGGGIYKRRGTLTVDASTISGNSNSRGGGIYVTGDAVATIAGSTISDNSARGDKGGGICVFFATLTVTSSTISGNSTDDYRYGFGGGIDGDHGTLTIIDSTISDNSAVFGGGIRNDRGTTTIANSSLCGNSASSLGGGIRIDGGTLMVTDTTISRNSSGRKGGAIYNDRGTATITASTIAHNSAATAGGGIYVTADDRSLLTLANTIVASNSASENAPDIFGEAAGAHNLISDGSDIIGLSHDVDGNLIGTPAAPIDPRFVRNPSAGPDGVWGTEDDDPGDLRLTADSPAIDAGDNLLLPADEFDLDGDGDTDEPIPVDLWGNPRVENGTVDIGAFEFLDVDSLHPGDANRDGVTDVRDFMIWNAHKFTSGTGWTRGDFDGDDVTDVRDFMLWNANKFTSAAAPAPEAGEMTAEVAACLEGLEGDRPIFVARKSGQSPAAKVVDRLLATYWA